MSARSEQGRFDPTGPSLNRKRPRVARNCNGCIDLATAPAPSETLDPARAAGRLPSSYLSRRGRTGARLLPPRLPQAARPGPPHGFGIGFGMVSAWLPQPQGPRQGEPRGGGQERISLRCAGRRRRCRDHLFVVGEDFEQRLLGIRQLIGRALAGRCGRGHTCRGRGAPRLPLRRVGLA
jgi:hypothetical protein